MDGFIIAATVLGAIGLIFALQALLLSEKRTENQILVAWQALTIQESTLTFVSGDVERGRPQVIGSYNDHPVKLYTWQGYTRLKVLPNQLKTYTYLEIDTTDLTKEHIINLMRPVTSSAYSKCRITFSSEEKAILCEISGLETNTTYLTSLLKTLCKIMDDYEYMIYLGGEIVVCLQEIVINKESSNPLKHTSIELLRAISAQTLLELETQDGYKVCIDCLTRFTRHKINLPNRSLDYYGCRICRQSRRFFENIARTSLILENINPNSIVHKKSLLVVNWMVQRQMVDFDEIHILSATDEEVERFLVSLKNNSSAEQLSYYDQMLCRVSTSCNLSNNTLNILRHTFGRIKV